MPLIHNLNNLRDRRRKLRKNMTPQEHIIWAKVRNKQLSHKFYRQHSIGPYIVDFYCPSRKLIIEIDGNHHLTPEENSYDTERSVFFQNLGFKIIRISNTEIIFDIKKVINKIILLL